jgi:hypothetical protein
MDLETFKVVQETIKPQNRVLRNLITRKYVSE